MPTFQDFLLKDNNDKETKVPASRTSQKINSKEDVEQELLIPCAGQKVSTGKKEHSDSKAHKS